MKLLNNKKLLLFISLIITLAISFIPSMGVRVEGSYRFFGYPAQWLGYHGDTRFSFELFGLLLDIFIFYIIILVLSKIVKNIILKIQK